jgi:HSP20 family protein
MSSAEDDYSKSISRPQFGIPFTTFNNGLNLPMYDSHSPHKKTRGVFLPISTIETDKSYIIELELPGVKPDDVDITIKEGSIFIHGEKKFNENNHRISILKIERNFGYISKNIKLPINADTDTTEFYFQNGILTFHITKTLEKKYVTKTANLR